MQAFLDDGPLMLERATFAAALAAAVEAAREKGRMVSEVWLDGAPVGAAILQHPPEVALGREVRIVSVEAPAAVNGVLAGAQQALERAAAAQSSAADLIMTARLEEALAPLAESVAAWQQVQELVTRELSWAAGLESFEAMLADLAGRLREVQRALRMQDWSALADVLAYHMKEQAEGWRALISGVSGDGAGSRE
jgi:malonyl CoA-acyl carrier protein transacylase